jgi:hypothetical protein
VTPITQLADAALERQIKAAYHELVSASNQEDKQKAMNKMAALVAKRSPAQIARMEKGMADG